MPDVPPEPSRFLVDVKKFADEFQAVITLLAFIVPLTGIFLKVFLDRQKDIPDLHFELVDVKKAGAENDVTFGLKITNIGRRPATRARYTWTPRSSLLMTPMPSGFLIPNDEPRRFEFTMDSDELIGHAIAGGHYNMLGWLELTYDAG